MIIDHHFIFFENRLWPELGNIVPICIGGYSCQQSKRSEAFTFVAELTHLSKNRLP